MQEIITNEFIQYKTGFIAGKNEMVETFKLGKIINLKKEENIEQQKDSWYSFGYIDGFNYFANLIDNNQLDLEKINTREITKQNFIERVLKINQEQGKEISVGKFKF